MLWYVVFHGMWDFRPTHAKMIDLRHVSDKNIPPPSGIEEAKACENFSAAFAFFSAPQGIAFPPAFGPTQFTLQEKGILDDITDSYAADISEILRPGSA